MLTPRRSVRRQRSFFAFVAVAAVIAGCGGREAGSGDRAAVQDAPDTVEPGTADPLDAGRAVFLANCATCHGADGQGGLGPKLADGAVVDRYPDPVDHRTVVINGRGMMPAFGEQLTTAEIDAVVRYEREGL